MSIEERDEIRPLNQKEFVSSLNSSGQAQLFIQQLRKRPEGDLARPFGKPNWLTLGLLAGLTVLAILFFTHAVDLGKATLNWKISFDVNLVAGLVVVIAGIAAFGPKALKNPRILQNQATLSSIVLLAIVAAFFFLRVLDLGTFIYTLDKIDLSALVGLAFVGGIVGLTAVRRSALSGLVLFALFLWWGFSIKAFGFITVADLFTSTNGGRLLRSLTPPRWEYFTKVIDPMLLTVQTAVAATVIGVVLALPLSILAARNTSPHPVIYNIIRFVINTVRAIPALVLALLFIPFVGLGPGAGILGLAIHSISVLTKLYAEAFESVKPQPLEALNAVGANGLKTFRWGVFPQAFPLIASYSIFNWESNGRDSTVVAFVGGGGIGFLLQANLSLLDYANVSVMLIVLIITVALLDRFSDFVRSKII